jgi:hypothetical protein
MKKVLFALVVVVLLATVASAQMPVITPTGGVTPWSKACTTAAPASPAASACTVTGYTTLQAVKVEGLTLIIPNEIDFSIANGQKYNAGNQPLTATTIWDLSNSATTGYTNIVVTAWFQNPLAALTASDGSGSLILPSQIIGKMGGNGAEVTFDGTAAPFQLAGANYTDANVTATNAVGMYMVPTTTGSTDGGISGTASGSMTLYIDDSGTTPIAPLAGQYVYQGTLWVTASAI